MQTSYWDILLIPQFILSVAFPYVFLGSICFQGATKTIAIYFKKTFDMLWKIKYVLFYAIQILIKIASSIPPLSKQCSFRFVLIRTILCLTKCLERKLHKNFFGEAKMRTRRSNKCKKILMVPVSIVRFCMQVGRNGSVASSFERAERHVVLYVNFVH